jgi:hypothetical protein
MKKLLLAVCFCVSWAVTCYGQTALRPDQISPATPDITWAPGGNGYQIGSTIPWRLETGATLVTPLSSADNARIVELTFNGLINATLPDATSANNLGDGAGFTIQVGPGSLTLSRASSSLINGKPSIKVGPYQIVSLTSRGANWYGSFSLPQPTTQTGATVLCDDMTWHSSPCSSGTPPTITGVTLSNGTNFTTSSSNANTTIDTLTATCSPGSCIGAAFALATTGSCAGAASASNGSFAIPGSTNNLNIGGTSLNTPGSFPIGIAVTLAGATNSGTCYPQTLVGAAPGAGIVFKSIQDTISLSTACPSNVCTVNFPATAVGDFFAVLPVSYSGTSAITATGVTINGVACAHAGNSLSESSVGPAVNMTDIFYCANGPGGNVAIATTFSGAATVYLAVDAMSFSGVSNSGADVGLGNHGSTPVDTRGTTISVSPTGNLTKNNQLVVSTVGTDTSPITSVGANQLHPGPNFNPSYQIIDTTGVLPLHTYNVGSNNSMSVSIAVFDHP